MPLEFEFNQKDELIITYQIKLFDEFADILNEVKPKRKANQLLHYVYLLCDRSDKNPLRDLDSAVKQEQCLYRAFKVRDVKLSEKEQQLVKAAIQVYKTHNESSKDRIKFSIERKIDQLAKMLDDTTPEIIRNIDPKTGNVNFASNTKIIMDSIKELNNTLSTLDKVEASIMKQKNERQVGNKGKSSMLESGRLNTR